jgi:tetratricopeptide (TPR) repeat protein
MPASGRIVLLATFLTLAPAAARAQVAESAPTEPPVAAPALPEIEDPRPVEAKTACASGRIDEGIEILARLFAEANEPIWVFNQGRCYEQNGRTEAAILRFREFLRLARAQPADEQRAEAIRAAEEHLAALEKDQHGAAAPAPAPLALAATIVDEGAEQRERRAARYRAGALGCAALTAAGVATAVVFGLKTRAEERAVRAKVDGGGILQSELTARRTAGERDETLQWVGYGVAGTSLITGAVLLLLGREQPSGAPLVAPLVDQRAAGAALSVRF